MEGISSFLKSLPSTLARVPMLPSHCAEHCLSAIVTSVQEVDSSQFLLGTDKGEVYHVTSDSASLVYSHSSAVDMVVYHCGSFEVESRAGGVTMWNSLARERKYAENRVQSELCAALLKQATLNPHTAWLLIRQTLYVTDGKAIERIEKKGGLCLTAQQRVATDAVLSLHQMANGDILEVGISGFAIRDRESLVIKSRTQLRNIEKAVFSLSGFTLLGGTCIYAFYPDGKELMQWTGLGTVAHAQIVNDTTLTWAEVTPTGDTIIKAAKVIEGKKTVVPVAEGKWYQFIDCKWLYVARESGLVRYNLSVTGTQSELLSGVSLQRVIYAGDIDTVVAVGNMTKPAVKTNPSRAPILCLHVTETIKEALLIRPNFLCIQAQLDSVDIYRIGDSISEKRTIAIGKAIQGIFKVEVDSVELLGIFLVSGSPQVVFSNPNALGNEYAGVPERAKLETVKPVKNHIFLQSDIEITCWNIPRQLVVFTLTVSNVITMLPYENCRNTLIASGEKLCLYRENQVEAETDWLRDPSDTSISAFPSANQGVFLSGDCRFCIVNIREGLQVLNAEDLCELRVVAFEAMGLRSLNVMKEGNYAVGITGIEEVVVIDLGLGTVTKEMGANGDLQFAAVGEDCLYLYSSNRLVSIGEYQRKRTTTTDSSNMYYRPGSFTLDSMLLFSSLLKHPKQPLAPLSRLSIEPSGVNLLHIFADAKGDERLQQALDLNISIAKSVYGSPLLIALLRKNTVSVQAILKHLIRLQRTDPNQFVISVTAIEDAMIPLLASGGKSLVKFLEMLFCPIWQEGEVVCQPISRGKSYFSSGDLWVRKSDFAGREQTQVKQKVVELSAASAPLPLALGASDSIEMLQSIRWSKDPSIMQSALLQSVIEYKWRSLWPAIFIAALVYWVMMGALVYLLFQYNLGVWIVFLSGNGLLVAYEIVQIIGDFREYLSLASNYIDLTRAALCFYWAYAEYCRELTWAVVLFSLLRGYSSFRAFDSTRYYVKIIIVVSVETRAFLLLFLYSTFAFGLLLATAAPEDAPTLFNSFWDSFTQIMSFEATNSAPLYTLTLFLAAVVNIVLMLNLLVAVLSEAFDRLRAGAIEGDLLTKLEIILEYEKLMRWARGRNERSYLQMCQKKEIVMDEQAVKKVRKLKEEMRRNQAAMEAILARHSEQLASLQSQVSSLPDSVRSSLSGQFTNVLDSLTEQISALSPH